MSWVADTYRALTGVPIAGAVLERSHGSYFGLIVFAGVSYVAGTACFVGLVVLIRQSS